MADWELGLSVHRLYGDRLHYWYSFVGHADASSGV